MPNDVTSQQLLKLTQQLLDAIAAGDWATYERLCDPSLTCFEPEARGHLVQGLPFHRFYFNLSADDGAGSRTTTIASPHVRVMGDVAVVSYVRLTQRTDEYNGTAVSAVNETRVWQRQGDAWKHVHFHRSPAE